MCRYYGVERMDLAEDIASDTFLAAVENWSFKGIPENPVGWLYTVARHKAINALKRDLRHASGSKWNQEEQTPATDPFDWSEQNIEDSQLRMLFVLSHPSLSRESQVALSLRILCGFGIDEIANAFLTNKEAINKRLFRAKEKLREERVAIELPGINELSSRLDAVLTTLYLLFNEGYYSESSDDVIREDLCQEAMRLTQLLLANDLTDQPKVNALMALMCFHSSRFEARKGNEGGPVLYYDQDESRWNALLISRGTQFLHRASTGDSFSRYHLEASIAYWHTVKKDSNEKWESILQLYNHLLALDYSPMAALNRTYALARVKGKTMAIAEAEKLGMDQSPYYHALLGELYTGVDNQKALNSYTKALAVVKTKPEKHLLLGKIENLNSVLKPLV